MIEIPVYNKEGQQVETLSLDEAQLGGEVRHGLLKQAYVRCHANKRMGTAATKNRSQTSYSTRKLYKQKGTGNARRGDRNANILIGGGRTFAKKARDFRQDMPKKMRRLANRNAILAKAVDGEIKLIDSFGVSQPKTKEFATLLANLGIDRNCLVALASTRDEIARSAGNLANVNLTRIDQLNVFNVLNNRYLLAEKALFEAWLEGKINAQAKSGAEGSATALRGEAA